jgi:hypothetical protein
VKWVFLIAVICLTPAFARAQVTVNHAALVQLAGLDVAPSPVAPVVRKPVRPVAHRAVHKAAPVAAVAVMPAPVKPVPPAAPAPVPVVAKPVIPPPKPVLPPPLVVNFSAGSAALPGTMAAALKPFCAAPGATAIIDAYAPPDPADPSAAMRLSLSRAFALRDALAACGVPAARIIPRADGATGKNLETARIFISGTAQ